ncbi:hypothetical protein TWF696_001186 [Orbilia brochopaga]|uniref:Secreted protein n=1 Tax=Orbilia brochopaga TaxID=3140254 RepID=A0AAV9U885_9PEZI
MPSNRPFLASLLVAFRAHSALQKPSGTLEATGGAIVSPTRASVSPRPPAAAATNCQPGAGPQQTPPQSICNTRQHSPTRRRRSSSSSTDGMMNSATGEKWWIGGRAGDGQARFYQLQPVRHRSLDRLSLDRLSL